jgi:hypothetical protein
LMPEVPPLSQWNEIDKVKILLLFF